MNYGRYFRLNQALSKVVSGVAVYDYIDLPAYFGPSEDNPMSPKYPISVTITSDTVCFRLHYSAFKLVKSGDSEFPQYAYDRDDIDRKALDKKQVNVGMAHMEEAILELSFADISSIRLSDTIKEIYNTKFPLQEKEGEEQISYGGRFIEQLIRKRYPGYIRPEEEVKEVSLEDKLYHKLQIVSDNAASYSSLWLMDLKNNSGDAIYLYNRNKKNTVIGFLRKLLLDFMFDLKHSDVFQNNTNYQKMYSGLMSDFYFSALMHKCEYYYYRKITSKAIEDNERVDETISKKQNKERIEKGKKTIALLYANELIQAEDLWIQDIMNPQAEKVFEHKYPGKHNLLREFIEYYNFKQWPSWFAEPEEEMRRVCFTMKDKTGEKHICNSDTLVRYLNLQAKGEDASIVKMIELRNDGREKISKWFLKQYAFSDVFHLHLFKHSNSLFLWLIALPCLLSLFSCSKLFPWISLFSFALLSLIIAGFYVKCVYTIINNKLWIYSNFKKYRNNPTPKLVVERKKIVWKRIGFIFLAIIIGGSLIYWREKLSSLWWFVGAMAFLLIIRLAPFNNLHQRSSNLLRQLIASLHLLLPRLAASIALAWITLSMGFDLYVSYFDYQLNWYYITCIVLIVVIFVMYEINRIAPHSSPLRKLLRSLELLIISYFISLFVGLVVINFLGEKYLERGGYMKDYYEQYVNHDGYQNIRLDTDSISKRYANQNITKSNIPSKDDSLYMICQRILAKMETSKNDSIFPRADSLYSLCQSILAKMDTSKNDSIFPRADSLYLVCQSILKEVKTDTNDFSRKLVDSLVYVYREKAPLLASKERKQYIAAKEKFWGMDVFILRNFLIMFAFIAMFTGIFIQLIIFGNNKQMTEL